MCKKRKEKKLNMQGKDNMVLDYFIIYTHATHEKRSLVTILPTLKPKRNSRKKRNLRRFKRQRERRKGFGSKFRLFLVALIQNLNTHTRKAKRSRRWQVAGVIHSSNTHAQGERSGPSSVSNHCGFCSNFSYGFIFNSYWD